MLSWVPRQFRGKYFDLLRRPLDQLAALHPALFDKYLYVGTTRAATYLGVTCDGALPPAIESLRAHFGQDWQAPGSLQAGTEQ